MHSVHYIAVVGWRAYISSPHLSKQNAWIILFRSNYNYPYSTLNK